MICKWFRVNHDIKRQVEINKQKEPKPKKPIEEIEVVYEVVKPIKEMSRTVIVHRDWQDQNESLGTCYVKDENGKVIFKSESLERGWRNNEKGVSCIPAGTYNLKLEFSPRFKKDLWEIYGVPNRSECKFHASNYWRQLNGCIALGNNRRDIDKDGYLDVTASRDAMKRVHKAMHGYTRAKVIVYDI